MKTKLTNQEIEEIWKAYYAFRDNPCLAKVYNTPQHRTSNTYKHVSWVAKECINHVIKRNLHYDFMSLIRGAFLHDFFFYDWRKDKEARKKHLSQHPERAIKNAKELFMLSDTEIDIIRNHMWPINITKFPKTKEGRLVMMMDKKVTMKEFFSHKKELLIFDLDGTLLDSLPDLHKATNVALEKNGFPLRSIEETRKAIGNGVAMLIRRSLPKGTDEEKYKKVLSDFELYYKAHSSDLTTAYEGMQEALTTLRRRGYRLAVATNKLEDVANELVEKFYPHLFQTVCGDNGVREKKPAPDAIKEIMKRLKVHSHHKIVYIGDSEVDYETAKNASVMCILATYGYRTRDELLQQNLIGVNFIEKPSELKSIFRLVKSNV